MKVDMRVHEWLNKTTEGGMRLDHESMWLENITVPYSACVLCLHFSWNQLKLLINKQFSFICQIRVNNMKSHAAIVFCFCSFCLLVLTSLLRTAKKQPLLCSEGSNTKNGSTSTVASPRSDELKGDGLGLDKKVQHITKCKNKQDGSC